MVGGTGIGTLIRRWLVKAPVEPRILAAIAALAGLIWVFAALAEDVLEEESHPFDAAIMKALRVEGDLATPIGPHWLEAAFRDLTSLGGPTVITLVTAIAVAFLLVAGRLRLAVLTAVAISLGAIVEKLLKWTFNRPRPEIVPHLVEVNSLSFPSGHAMLSAMTYLTLGALLAQAQTRWRLRGFVFGVSAMMTLLVGTSRVYLGVHWPSDVLAGWAAGAAWALMFWFIARRISRGGGTDRG